MLFGAFRILTEIPLGDLLILIGWLVGAVAIHDGLLSPAVVAVGWVVARRVRPRARRYVQFGLVVGASVTVIAVPLIVRRESQPRSKALLLRDYPANLTLLLGVVAVASLLGYAAHVAIDVRGGRRSAPESTHQR